MSIIADHNDPHENEAQEFEFHRLMGIAESYTGAEALRQKLPSGDYETSIQMLARFIEEEDNMRDLTPLTIEAMRERVQRSVDKDDFYER